MTYVGDYFTLYLTAGATTTGATAKILYRCNDGPIASASAVSSSVSTGEYYKAFTPTLITEEGVYKFWLEVTFASGTVSFGTPYKMPVSAAG